MVDRAIIEAIERLAGRIASIEAHGKPVDGLSLAEALVMTGTSIGNALSQLASGVADVAEAISDHARAVEALSEALRGKRNEPTV